MTDEIEAAIIILELLGFPVERLPDDTYTIWDEGMIMAWKITGVEIIEWADTLTEFLAD
jgi:hypothetical protein